MSFAADLHLHSPYARGTSPALSLQTLAAWADIKGVDLLACGDFTHPAWLAELKRSLRPVDDDLFELATPPEPQDVRGRGRPARFVLGTEVSCVYTQDGRGRRLHLLILAPDFDAVDGICRAFAPHGSLASDGRPMLRLSARDVVEAVLSVDARCEVVPAHAWTPWYAIFGSKSGFDSLDDCFGDMAGHVHAIETGLSSDPEMNWRVPDLDDRTLVSFSDAHSAQRLGRELTVFAGEPGYGALVEALRADSVEWTAEFYPQEGKYHHDGHRKCGVNLPPDAHDGRCPACGRKLTLGVLNRVQSLAGRPPEPLAADADGVLRGTESERPPFRRLVPLAEIVAEALGYGLASKAVQRVCRDLAARVGTELHVLTAAEASEIERAAGERVAEGVMRARLGRVRVRPGFDGEYGVVRLWDDDTGTLTGGQGATEHHAAEDN
ncbi:MAG: endonuclease Q family protein [Chloroflexota bacterium]|nr:endonuclease Q family protein [Chloroflexota bacterium]